MNLENIHEGMVVKNYKEMCDLLGEKATTSSSKNSQIKRWRKNFDFEQNGHKITIKKILKESKEEVGRHGLSNTRLYKILDGMKQRCYNIKCDSFSNYGGRGISICDEWLDKENGFLNFYNWSINNGYDDSLTIDRINNNGNYEPDNCRWTTWDIQMKNRRKPTNRKSRKGKKRSKNKTITKSELVEYIKYLEDELKNHGLSDVVDGYKNKKNG